VFDRLSHSSGLADEATMAATARHHRRAALLRETVAIERNTILQLRDENTIGDEVLRRIERELDLTETRYDSRE
jgi:hypothetical protein